MDGLITRLRKPVMLHSNPEQTNAEREEAALAIERMAKAIEMQEAAEAFHLSCVECEGNEIPELCEACFPHYDDARVARRTALALSAGKSQ